MTKALVFIWNVLPVAALALSAGAGSHHAQCFHFNAPGKHPEESLEAAPSATLPTQGMYCVV